MKHPALLYLAAALTLLVAGYSCGVEPQPQPARPITADSSPAHEWAATMTVEDLDNLHRVSPRLYRGAQPTAEGFTALDQLGVKTVINLRAMHDDDDEVKEAGLTGKFTLHHISFKTWHPEKEDIEAFLGMVADPANGLIFVHCQHGSDRTGTMCAIYRIVVDGWDREAAIDEMVHGDFGFHGMWQNLIDFIRNDISDADIAAWRQKYGPKER